MNAPLDSDDSGLRDAFSALRAAREVGAGRFHENVRIGRSRARLHRERLRIRLALTLAVALPAAAGLSHHLVERGRQQEALRLAQEAAAIAVWRSPTETLLTYSYEDLIREIPSLDASVLDPQTPTEAGGGSQ